MAFQLAWKLFSDPAIEPKETIRKECKFKDTDHAKRAMNESLNGSGRYKKTYLHWFQREFPTLYELWQKTDVKHTGKNIAEKFERPLIQDKELCDLADRLGIKVISEHDGVGVFAADDDIGLDGKLKRLAAHIEANSIRLFGVPVVVKSKPVFDLLDGDLRAGMQHKRRQYEKDLNRLKPNVDRFPRLHTVKQSCSRHNAPLQQLCANFESARSQPHWILPITFNQIPQRQL